MPDYATREEVDTLFERTWVEMSEFLQPYKGRHVCYAWSGSHKSLVLKHLLDQIDIPITGGVQSTIPLLEFSEFLRWADEVRPIDVSPRPNNLLNMKWLQRFNMYLFPTNANYLNFWDRIVTHRNIENYIYDRGPAVLITGKTIDVKMTSRAGHGCLYYNPLRGWHPSQILGYLHYHCIELPPHYEWGMGTAPWPARCGCKDRAEGWALTYEVDPSVVVEASYFFNSAERFLNDR